MTSMDEVTSKNRFKCHICLKTLTTKLSLDRQRKSFECDICKKSLVQNIREEKKYNCNVCGKQFTDKSNLSNDS